MKIAECRVKIDGLSIGEWRLVRRRRSFVFQSAIEHLQSVNRQSAVCSLQ